MGNEVKIGKTERKTTETSMSNASEPICQEEECIGKVTVINREDAPERAKTAGEMKKPAARSSMKFGRKDACWDEECIGKT